MVDAEEKAAFAQYASTSGASALLSKAVVALSRAVVNPKSPLSPDSAGTFLRDALHGAEEQPEHTVLDEKEKEKVSSFLTSSGANDIIARALVALFNESPRPPSSVAFLRAYFAAEFGQPAGTGELDRGSELAPGADSAAPAPTAELHGEEQPPVSEPAAMAVGGAAAGEDPAPPAPPAPSGPAEPPAPPSAAAAEENAPPTEASEEPVPPESPAAESQPEAMVEQPERAAAEESASPLPAAEAAESAESEAPPPIDALESTGPEAPEEAAPAEDA